MMTGFDLVRAAMAVDGVTANERSVLMVLAVMANDEAQAWPPISGETGLTTKCVLSERAVQRAIKQLVELGHLSRRQLRNGVIYTVHPARPVTQSGVNETGDDKTPDSQAKRGGTQAPKLPVTTKPKLKRATGLPAEFTPVMTGKTKAVVDGWPPGRLADELEHFADHHTAKGTTSFDWQASWRTWVKNSKRWGTGNGERNRSESSRNGPRNTLVAAAAADLARRAGDG